MHLRISQTRWPIEGSFTISRGSKTTADVVMVELIDGEHVGRGECVPYARYGESLENVTSLIEKLRGDIEQGISRIDLQDLMPSGAARNAVDCALWDLEAKKQGTRVWSNLDLSTFETLTTAYTLSLDTAENMGRKATEVAHLPLLKLKLAGPGDLDRVEAVRKGAPDSRLIVDANEGWTIEIYDQLAPRLQELGVELIEQPLPAGDDDLLAGRQRPVPVCADESVHDRKSLPNLIGKYDLINIKLDKTGGLTEALLLKEEAEKAGLGIMVGCMLAPSLAMAPAMVVAQGAQVVDLDGPLLLAKDHEHPIVFENGLMYPPPPALWG